MSITGGWSGTAVMALVATVLTACWLVVSAPPAAADCTSTTVDDAFRGATSVFVGQVSGRRGGHVRFDTGEVWTGPDLAAQVWVRTDGSSAPLEEGETYLVGAADGFLTGDCLLWPADDAQVAQARPVDVRTPSPDGSAGAQPPPGALTLGLGGLGLAVVLGGAFTAVRVRRRRNAAVAGYGPGA